MASSPSPRRNRWHLRNIDDAVAFLCKKARNAFKASGRPHILIVGGADPIAEAIREDLAQHGMTPVLVSIEAIEKDGAPTSERYACVLCAFMDIRRTTATARVVLADRRLSDLPFEYVTFPETSYASLVRHDTEGARDKVSPLPTYPMDVFALYEASLDRFEKNVTSGIIWMSASCSRPFTTTGLGAMWPNSGPIGGTAAICWHR